MTEKVCPRFEVKAGLPRYMKGFTLVELIVIIAIATILFGMGIPSFRSMMQNTRLATQANAFVSDLNLARSEAVKRGEPVALCKSANGSTCVTTGTWQQGWIVRVPGTGELLRVRGELKGGMTLTGNANVANSITYRANGTVTQQGTVKLCAQERGVNIIINMGGRARTESTTCP